MYPSTDYPKQYVSSSPPPTAPPPPQFSYDPPAIGLPHVTPGATNPPINNNIAWSTGLCDCCDDAGNCCLTCWCPCITFGKVAEIVDQGSSSCGTSGALYALLNYFTGCACCLSCVYRTRLRKQYQLEESPCGDCLVHCFCEQCSLCQEYRELKNRGFDMSIGWYANVQRQSQGVVPPVVQHGMSR